MILYPSVWDKIASGSFHRCDGMAHVLELPLMAWGSAEQFKNSHIESTWLFLFLQPMDGDDSLRSVLVSQIASHHYSLMHVDHMTVLPGQGTGYRELREHWWHLSDLLGFDTIPPPSQLPDLLLSLHSQGNWLCPLAVVIPLSFLQFKLLFGRAKCWWDKGIFTQFIETH